MDTKTELKKIIDLGGHKRRNTLKYLSKRNPDMWNEMIRLTSFLPDTASAPQRAWHIMNDVNSIPICPVTQKEVKWIGYDNGYTSHSSHKASRITVAKILRDTTTGENHWRKKDTKKADQATDKFKNGQKAGIHKVATMTQESVDERTKKAAQTCLERYGVDNYWKSEEFKIKQKEYYDEKFKEVRANRSEQEKYYEEVGYYTEKNWNEYFYKINPTRIERGPEMHLDHIYSRAEGFKNGIAAEIIGHWTNLQLISRTDNSSKRDRCDKTQQQLFEDYENAKTFVIE